LVDGPVCSFYATWPASRRSPVVRSGRGRRFGPYLGSRGEAQLERECDCGPVVGVAVSRSRVSVGCALVLLVDVLGIPTKKEAQLAPQPHPVLMFKLSVLGFLYGTDHRDG